MKNVYLTKYQLLIATMLNSILFLLVYTFFTPTYLTNDDVALNLLAAGTVMFAESSPYLIYTNAAIGWLLNQLYRMSMQVNWYGWYLVLSLFVAHVGLFWFLLKKTRFVVASVIYLAYFFLIGILLLLYLQYTIVATMVCLVGLLIMMVAKQKYVYLIGGLLVIWGSMIRLEPLIMVCILFIPAFLINYKQIDKVKWIVLGSVILASGLVYGINKWSYPDNIKEMVAFEKAKVKILDEQHLEFLPPPEAATAWNSVGWSKMDYLMFMNYCWMDQDIYTTAKLEKLADYAYTIKPLNTQDVVHYLVFYVFLQNRFTLNCLFLLAFFFLVFKTNKLTWLVQGITLILILGIILYIGYTRKPLALRVLSGMFLCWSILPLLFNHYTFTDKIKTPLVGGLLACLLLVAIYWIPSQGVYYVQTSKQNKENNIVLKQTLSHLNPTTDKLFISWASAFPWEYFHPFESLDYLKNFKAFMLGALQKAPPSIELLKQFDIQDFYLEICDKENVYLLNLRQNIILPDLYNNYMQQHYGIKVKMDIVQREKHFDVYKVSRK